MSDNAVDHPLNVLKHLRVMVGGLAAVCALGWVTQDLRQETSPSSGAEPINVAPESLSVPILAPMAKDGWNTPSTRYSPRPQSQGATPSKPV